MKKKTSKPKLTEATAKVNVEAVVIQQGQIWEVAKDGFLGNRWIIGIPSVKEIIPIGMRLEIRCPYAWHYRTEENKYYQSDEDEILKYCKLIGSVKEATRWHNRHELKEILQEGLWDALAV